MRSMSETRKIFAYFLSTEAMAGPELAPSGFSDGPRWEIVVTARASEDTIVALRPRADLDLRMGLLEHTSDDLLERRVVNAHIGDLVLIEDRAEHVRDTGAINLQLGDRPLLTADLAVSSKVVR